MTGERWCEHHGRGHDPGEWVSPLCWAWDHAEPRRPARPLWCWVKRLTVCWWKHRTRQVFPGVFVSTACRCCT